MATMIESPSIASSERLKSVTNEIAQSSINVRTRTKNRIPSDSSEMSPLIFDSDTDDDCLNKAIIHNDTISNDLNTIDNRSLFDVLAKINELSKNVTNTNDHPKMKKTRSFSEPIIKFNQNNKINKVKRADNNNTSTISECRTRSRTMQTQRLTRSKARLCKLDVSIIKTVKPPSRKRKNSEKLNVTNEIPTTSKYTKNAKMVKNLSDRTIPQTSKNTSLVKLSSKQTFLGDSEVPLSVSVLDPPSKCCNFAKLFQNQSTSSISDVQILSEKVPTIIVLTGSTDCDSIKQNETNFDSNMLHLSPDLFADDNNDEFVDCSQASKNDILQPKRRISESPMKSGVNEREQMNKSNVFEITTNNAFSNLIRINENSDMSPIVLSDNTANDQKTVQDKTILKETVKLKLVQKKSNGDLWKNVIHRKNLTDIPGPSNIRFSGNQNCNINSLETSPVTNVSIGSILNTPKSSIRYGTTSSCSTDQSKKNDNFFAGITIEKRLKTDSLTAKSVTEDQTSNENVEVIDLVKSSTSDDDDVEFVDYIAASQTTPKRTFDLANLSMHRRSEKHAGSSSKWLTKRQRIGDERNCDLNRSALRRRRLDLWFKDTINFPPKKNTTNKSKSKSKSTMEEHEKIFFSSDEES